MLLTAYLDESGTHETSPISVMAGYLGTADQWRAFDADWTVQVQTAGLRHVHAVDLFKRKKQFKEWPAERVNALAVQLDGVIARHLQLGFSVIIRDNDYRKFTSRDHGRAERGSIANMACVFGPALLLPPPTLRRNCSSSARRRSRRKRRSISFWRTAIATSATPAGSSIFSRPTLCPSGSISLALSMCRGRIVPGLKRPIFSLTAYIGLNFSNTAPHPRQLRSRPMSPTCH